MGAASDAARVRHTRWSRIIDDVSSGIWISPDTAAPVDVPFKSVIISDDLSGIEGELVRAAMPAERYAVVCDKDSFEAQGKSVARALAASAVTILLDEPHADEAQVAALQERTRDADALVAVGSGTINDLCKYATALDGRPYCVFGTAPSMNGYTSTTASITLHSGLKTTKPAHAAKGVFIDLKVNSAAPAYLIAAGFGDSISRSCAQVDWHFSHVMLATPYLEAPYALQKDDEAEILARSGDIGQRDLDGVGFLQRLLTLTGLGLSVAGMSHPGSMGEHQISHWIDSFAGDRHPGTVHGQQVGVTSITMARLQQAILSESRPPKVRPTQVDEDGIRRRYPKAAIEDCLAASHAKAFNQSQCDAFNAKLEAIWPELRARLSAMTVPADELTAHLRNAGGGATAAAIGIDRELYREALIYAREIRNRYSFLDLAADMGILNDFAAGDW